MKKLRVFFACVTSRLARLTLRLFGRGGTALPGKAALRVYPGLMRELGRGVETVIITGTNGKTTTAGMLRHMLDKAGTPYFSNRSGANLTSGITAEFIENADFLGKPKKTLAVIECDEGNFPAVAAALQPRAVIVTNLFRDQLDRYGEVTHTLENIRIGIENSPHAKLALNADDSLCTSLAGAVPNPVLFYGVNTPIYASRVEELSDAPYCIRCKHAYVYDYVTYGHLGKYRCPACGYSRPEPEIAVSEVAVTDAEHSEVVFDDGKKRIPATICLPGGYNIYNACAAMAAGKLLGLKEETVAASLASFSCGFGRMEKFRIHDVDVRMILIKNPAGCNQVLNYLTQLREPFTFVACLNDRAQDGVDVSWIWDVDFERLTAMGDQIASIDVSGRRAEDMAMRFKYAGFPTERLRVNKDYRSLIENAVALGKPVYVMPTYTAMLALRSTISKAYGYKEFWE